MGGGKGEGVLNYRHEFHAGNFADLLKHGLLLQILPRLTGEASPLAVLDTHAGAGLYDLEGAAAQRSGEAAQGVLRLMADQAAPAALEPLRRAVRALNKNGPVKFYPGSPLLIARALRSGDRYDGCELRPDDHAALQGALRPFANARAMNLDGYTALAAPVDAERRRLILIDPPYERGDEYPRLVEGVAQAQAQGAPACFAIWAPIKDLETFDAFLGGLEAVWPGQGVVVQARLKPLDDPLRMNGCAMVVLGDDGLLEAILEPAQAMADWIVATLGQAGGRSRVEPLR